MDRDQEQEKRLEFLLKKFKEDSIQYKDLEVEGGYEEKRRVLRSLMNIRMPRSMQENVVKLQDKFLAEEVKEKGLYPLATSLLRQNYMGADILLRIKYRSGRGILQDFRQELL